MSQRAFRIAILISLLLHLGLLVLTRFLPATKTPPPAPIEVSLIETPPAKPRPKAEAKPKDLKQIVDQSEQALNDETAKDAKYLSRHNQKVEKETKARQAGKFVNSDDGSQSPTMAHKNQNAQAAPVRPLKEAKGPGKFLKLKDLKPDLNWSREALAEKTGQGPSQSDDFIKDAESGPQTLLNTREFIYYTYYSRIKDKLRQYWEPKIKDKIARLLAQGRTIASNQDRITKMIITLDERGTLIRVQVIGESGIHDLDDAAIEAFRAAAPFPHPPAGIIESDGTIRIRWDFVLEARSTILNRGAFAQSDED